MFTGGPYTDFKFFWKFSMQNDWQNAVKCNGRVDVKYLHNAQFVVSLLLIVGDLTPTLGVLAKWDHYKPAQNQQPPSRGTHALCLSVSISSVYFIRVRPMSCFFPLVSCLSRSGCLMYLQPLKSRRGRVQPR